MVLIFFPPALSFTIQGLAAGSFCLTSVHPTSKQALEGAQLSGQKGKGKTSTREVGGKRKLSQLRDPPELLPHRGVICTNPLATLSGQEIFCFQVVRKSL